MKKYINAIIRLLAVTAFVAAPLLAVVPSQQNVQAAGPPGCEPARPYNCAMSRRKFDQEVNAWCGLANADKQAECRLKFYSFVHMTQSAVRSNAGFTIPSECGTSSQKELDDALDVCYVIAKKGTRYYSATKDLITECGTPPNQDQACASREKQQFLHDYDSSWASAPDTSGSSSTGTGIDTDTKASETPFIQRVNIYLRWITAGIGILAVFGLVISGIQYTAAGDNAQAVSDAKKRIGNIVIGLFIYMFMFAALQWLVPGGIF